MISTRTPSAVFSLALLLVASASAVQPPPTQELPVDISSADLVKRVRAAIGDEASWAAAAMVTYDGTMEFLEAGVTLNVHAIEGRGDLNISTMSQDGEVIGVEGCDEKGPWSKDDDGVSVSEGDEFKEEAEDCRFLSDIDIAGYKEIKVAAKARQGEKEFYLVDAYSASGLHDVLTVNAKTFLPEASIQQRHVDGRLSTYASVATDYRRVGGLLIPHVINIKIGNQRVAMRFESVVVSPTLDEAVFARPLK